MQEKSDIYAEFYRRLNQTIENHGLTISGVEKKLGIGRGTLTNAIKSGATLGIDKVFKILAMFPYEDLNWLFKGETPEDVEKILADDEKNSKVLPENNLNKIEAKIDYLIKQLQDTTIQVMEYSKTVERHEEQLKRLTGR